jgi:hypothetical protein
MVNWFPVAYYQLLNPVVPTQDARLDRSRSFGEVAGEVNQLLLTQ